MLLHKWEEARKQLQLSNKLEGKVRLTLALTPLRFRLLRWPTRRSGRWHGCRRSRRLQSSLRGDEEPALLTQDIRKKEEVLIRVAQPILTKPPPKVRGPPPVGLDFW